MLLHRWVPAPSSALQPSPALLAVALAAVLAAASCGQAGAGPQAHRPPPTSASSPGESLSSPASGPVASASPAARGTQSAPAGSSIQSGNTMSMYVTMYGWLDNSPPGADIEHPVIHKQSATCCAGGTGTYADPITFGTDEHELSVGTLVYVPHLKRYFVMEDTCDECTQDYTAKGPEGGPGVRRIEVWAGGNAQSGQALLNCEVALGTDTPVPVIVNPPPGLQVSSRPLFDPLTRSCYRPGT